MSEKYFDFDAFMDEVKETPVIVKVYGEKVELPSSMPADIMLGAVRLLKSGTQNVEAEYLHDISYGLFGKKNMDKWLKKGLTTRGLEELIKNVMKLYQKPVEEENKKKVEKSTPS